MSAASRRQTFPPDRARRTTVETCSNEIVAVALVALVAALGAVG